LEALIGPETEADKQRKAELLKKKSKDESNKHKKTGDKTEAAADEANPLAGADEPRKKLGDFIARDLAAAKNSP